MKHVPKNKFWLRMTAVIAVAALQWLLGAPGRTRQQTTGQLRYMICSARQHRPTLAYMRALHDAGVDVPAVYGQDAQGRQVTEFVPGCLAMDSRPLSLSELCRVGRAVRAIHDVSAAYEPVTGSVRRIPSP